MSKIRIFIALTAAAFAVIGLAACNDDNGDSGKWMKAPVPSSSASVAVDAGSAVGKAIQSVPVTTHPDQPKATPTKTTAPISAEQRNATRSAQDYLAGQSFSRSGLIDQLKYEGYSTKASTAAVDSLHTDWNAQAAKTAKDYLALEGFSRKGLISQLKYDGFTTAQATYGANKAGL